MAKVSEIIRKIKNTRVVILSDMEQNMMSGSIRIPVYLLQFRGIHLRK